MSLAVVDSRRSREGWCVWDGGCSSSWEGYGGGGCCWRRVIWRVNVIARGRGLGGLFVAEVVIVL